MNVPYALSLADALLTAPGAGSVTAYLHDASAELRGLHAENEALRKEVERLRAHAVTLANATYITTLERCAQLCDSHFNHEAKDCADEIRAMMDRP